MKRIAPILSLLVGSTLFAQTPPAATTPPPATRPPPATAPASPTAPQPQFEPHTAPAPLPNNNPAAASFPTGSVPANMVGPAAFSNAIALSNAAFALTNSIGATNSFLLTNQFAITNGISPNGTVDQRLLSVDQTGNLLLNLQANVQALLPVLENLTGVNAASSTTTPAATGTVIGQRSVGLGPQNSIVGVLGTNRVVMNRQTFELLVGAQDNLKRVLPLLRELNGAQVATGAGLQSPTFPTRVVILTNGRPIQVLSPTGR